MKTHDQKMQEAERLLRWCRLYIVDRKGYHASEAEERTKLQKELDAWLEPAAQPAPQMREIGSTRNGEDGGVIRVIEGGEIHFHPWGERKGEIICHFDDETLTGQFSRDFMSVSIGEGHIGVELWDPLTVLDGAEEALEAHYRLVAAEAAHTRFCEALEQADAEAFAKLTTDRERLGFMAERGCILSRDALATT